MSHSCCICFKVRVVKLSTRVKFWLIKTLFVCAFECVDPYMRRTALASIAAGLASAVRAFSNRVMFFLTQVR